MSFLSISLLVIIILYGLYFYDKAFLTGSKKLSIEKYLQSKKTHDIKNK
jgi:hypothetical protein